MNKAGRLGVNDVITTERFRRDTVDTGRFSVVGG